MAFQHHLSITDQRPAGGLRWLTLHAPELARTARPGHYVLVRCAAQGSVDPLLRRPLFVAAAEEALEQIGLLYAPNERGLQWLARGQSGETLDVIGPFGTPFTLDKRTRNLLLIGQGPGLAALMLLARQHVRRGGAATLLVGAESDADVIPPFLLPGEVEYQSTQGAAIELLRPADAEPPGDGKRRKTAVQPPASTSAPLITWADQICAALPAAQLPALRDTIRATKFRWERGYASALVDGPLICGVGACGVCGIETRHGRRWLCSDGPVFDLRDLVEG